MKLKEFLDENQIELCEKANITIEDREYTLEELCQIEHDIIEYVNERCIDEEFYLLEEEYDKIVDIIMDLESEDNNDNQLIIDASEGEHVKLSNGKTGIVVDATNNVYTVEIDEEFKTGSLDDDICIVAINSIIEKI